MVFAYTKKVDSVIYSHRRSESPEKEKFERHCHPFYELLYIVEGRGTFSVEGVEYILRKGMLMLLRPHEYHFVAPEPGATYERICINFSSGDPLVEPEKTETLQARYGAGLCFLPEALPLDAGELLRSLELCRKLPEDQALALFRSGLTQLLLSLSVSTPVNERSEDSLTADVMLYLSENLDRSIRLEDLAKYFYLSKYHLCRVFRSHAGLTVLEYLTAKRVARAQMLLASGVSAADAAVQSGFGDYSTFYRAYRRITGGPPTRARKYEDATVIDKSRTSVTIEGNGSKETAHECCTKPE